jgi:hypothetical protein
MAMQTEHAVCFHSDIEGFGTRPVLNLVLTDIGVRQLQSTKENGDCVNLFKIRHIYPVFE